MSPHVGIHKEWWNIGMMEYWVWKAEKDLSYKKFCIYILWWCPSDIHFLLPPIKYAYATTTKKSIQISLRFSKSTIPLSSPSRGVYEPEARTHDSNIPWFQHSNWGEAPNLSSFLYLRVLVAELLRLFLFIRHQVQVKTIGYWNICDNSSHTPHRRIG